MRLGLLGCSDHGGVTRIGAGIKDVIAHRAVHQAAVLLHHANLAAQAGLGDLGDILTIDQDLAVLGVIKAQDQLDQRRFPRT